MGPYMSEWINFKGLNALIALLKGFMVALPAKHGSHLGNLILGCPFDLSPHSQVEHAI